MCRRAGGLDSSQALQWCSVAIFKTHGQGAIVTMTNLLMNLL